MRAFVCLYYKQVCCFVQFHTQCNNFVSSAITTIVRKVMGTPATRLIHTRSHILCSLLHRLYSHWHTSHVGIPYSSKPATFSVCSKSVHFWVSLSISPSMAKAIAIAAIDTMCTTGFLFWSSMLLWSVGCIFSRVYIYTQEWPYLLCTITIGWYYQRQTVCIALYASHKVLLSTVHPNPDTCVVWS